jgi:putative hemolysin
MARPQPPREGIIAALWIPTDPRGRVTGRIVGLVTPLDVMEAIVGEFRSPAERLKPQAQKRGDGSWLVDGFMPLERVEQAVGQMRFPPADQRDCATLGEFAAARLGPATKEGATFDEQGCRFEILDMDEARVDKLLITPLNCGSPVLRTKPAADR